MTRVLIVDDKEENLYFLKSLLEANGFMTDAARHGAEALIKARQSPPEVVISDLLMPVMDGYTLLRHWKADERLRAVPFIVYTATYTDQEDERLALDLGADGFILKPCEPDDFLAGLRKALSAKSAPRRVPPREPNQDEEVLLREYSETLIRKLEKKTLELEESNRQLQHDIAAREQAEAELRRTEEQLRQAQKMEAIGRLAGGIAHDFNNLLSVILSYATVLQRNLKTGDPMRDDLEEVRRAGERASDLTRQLLSFSRQQMVQPKVLELGSVVEEMEAMLHRLMGEGVEVQVVTSPSGAKVLADAGQLEQIVLNLALNARDAMPLGGKLTLETSAVDVDAQFAAAHPEVEPGPYVLLSITDTGIGMDARTRERIFEPFFTTKEMGKGTGLGLSTVFGIVKQNRGHIWVFSEPGAGTSFKIYLPRTERQSDAVKVPVVSAAPESLRGDETILLVEGDDRVRAMSRTLLRRHGYTVLDAQNGGEAFLLCEKYAPGIDLLLTDSVMPRMSGRELAARLAPMVPDLRVLYISGHADDSEARPDTGSSEVEFLHKPITPDSLLQKVRKVLGTPA
jgi:two-component system, cell cycle sensor histidine kinase and response regulator CckA